MKILDVGCSNPREKDKDAIGIDINPGPKTDIVHDLNTFPWPFKDNVFDIILCKDIIEHLADTVKTMEEMHRIVKSRGIIKIYTPHFAHPNSYRDPTHKHHFSFGTFDYFTGDIDYPVYTNLKFRMIKRELLFRKKYCIGKCLARFSTRRYEKYYAHRWPPSGMYFEMIVLKKEVLKKYEVS